MTQMQDNEIDAEDYLKSKPAEDDSELTYSQEYYILNRKEILDKRKERELEAKFGDFSARLVKRPKKNFMWGHGTQMHEDQKSDHGKSKAPLATIVAKCFVQSSLSRASAQKGLHVALHMMQLSLAHRGNVPAASRTRRAMKSVVDMAQWVARNRTPCGQCNLRSETH